MLKRILVSAVILAATIFLPSQPALGAKADFSGTWELLPAESSEIALYGTLDVTFQLSGQDLTIIQKWGNRRSFSDTLQLETDGNTHRVEIPHRVFPTNVFMGLSKTPGAYREMTAEWQNDETLIVKEQAGVRGSQGMTPYSATHTYTLEEKGEILIYSIDRSTRKTGEGIRYVLKPEGSKEAFVMHLEDGWELDGKLSVNAMLISLQGVVNKKGPHLYFVYPDTWPFTYTESVFDYYHEQRHYTFKQLRTAEQALNTFKNDIQGYVVWDPEVRTSLIVSFTVAGLEDAIVVHPDLIPMAESIGLESVEDFRGQFTGMNDAEIYEWAYNQYWDRCNKDFIVWMGGPHGNVMRPGVADFGIHKEMFFNDLSTLPSDTAEYALADKLLGELDEHAMVMGWHSYAKDKERDHVTLTSKHGHRVYGLHSLPNTSFNHHIPFSPEFEPRNNHQIEPGKEYIPKEKVYIACVQTDGIGIGAWLKPGRGKIPYAWEVTMNTMWLAPGMMEYFFNMKTPNDYFIGALSGPGYMYPKAVPEEDLKELVAMAQDFMNKLDIRVFEIMDYSEGATVEGNTELTKDVVDIYYENMPDAIGFLNGYAPAFTFTIQNDRPLISYDYYLSPTRSETEAAADLEELAAINSNRPYFLLMHVRESSDVQRVVDILDRLGPEFEVVPLDVFIRMASNRPTFEERFLDR
jgi:hypothetical protein